MCHSHKKLSVQFADAVRYLVLFSAFTAAASCASSQASLGRQAEASANTLAWLNEHHGFVHFISLERLLGRVTAQLSGSIFRAALERKFDRGSTEYFRSFPWQVFVLEEETPNAFSLGAGVIVITRGMLERASSEAALAAVIAHEMSHQMLGHTAEAL
ncbi:MAG TPA: M48 family metalloprotease, partial [Oligoflexia bacterium]|nr:M48 family metalloprotease [Oligoflexia bacterium]